MAVIEKADAPPELALGYHRVIHSYAIRAAPQVSQLYNYFNAK
jgi:hypothetical protein